MPGTPLWGREADIVRIRRVAVAHPPFRVAQKHAAETLGRLTGFPRQVAAIARGSGIESRAIAVELDRLLNLQGPYQRNLVYREVAPQLAARAVCGVLPQGVRPGVFATTSCTGYHLPGWAPAVMETLQLPRDMFRVPLTEAGCAGGVVAIRCAAEVVRGQQRAGLAASVELCSLSLHLDPDPGNLTAAAIFGDGAGAALLEPGPGAGLEIVDASSTLVPGSREMLGFELRDVGFFPNLARELVEVVPKAASQAIDALLERNELGVADIAAWLVHPGGAAILRELQKTVGFDPGRAGYAWASLKEFGNTSSASIFDVLRRYMEEEPREGAWAVIAAFGPGVAIELLLVRAC